MQPPDDSQDVPSAKAKVHDTAPQERPVTLQEQPPQAQKASGGRRAMLAMVAIGLTLLALVAASTWSVLNRNRSTLDQPGAPSVPRNAITLINSSTPIPAGSPGRPDSLGDLSFAPPSQTWTSALAEAHLAQDEGRYSSAISQYSALVAGGSPEEGRDALWGLAESYAASGQPELAAQAYSLFAGLDDPRAPRALFRLGQVYEKMGRAMDALQAYRQYAKLAGPARHAVELLEANLMGGSSDAEGVYKGMINDKNAQDADKREALARYAAWKSARDDHKGAAALYDQLAAIRKEQPRPALDDSGAPPEMLAAGEVLLAGDVAGAKKRLLDYISSAPDKKIPDHPGGRYLALDALLKIDAKAVASGTVQPLFAANIAYRAGYFSKAIEFLNDLRASTNDPAQRSAASLLTGKAYESQGDPASAFNWYTATVQSYTTALEAPEAARRAGDALEEQSAWDEAIGAYKQAIDKYPNGGDQTALARLNGGVLAYRLDDRDTALALLQPMQASGEISPAIKAQGTFWVGKLQRATGTNGWKSTLGQVSSLWPGSFFDFRARSLQAGEPEGGPLVPTFKESSVPASGLGVRYAEEADAREDLLSWASNLSTGGKAISGTTATPTFEATSTITAAQHLALDSRLADDPELQRAVALLNLGYDTGASSAFGALAERLKSDGDATRLAEIVLYLRYHADPSTAMLTAQDLGDMDSASDPLKWPALLLKTIYPTPYGGLVLGESEKRDIDPLVMYALIRQESQFVPGAHSHADAYGLTQVIPQTGAGIAEQLGDSAFSTEQLLLPYISIRYGTYYLASNLPQFDRKLLPSLAAYNAGPGNAANWLAGSALIDPDLYGERIDLFETEDYLRRVYQNYGFYQAIYTP